MQLLPPLAPDSQLFVLGLSAFDFSGKRAAPLNGVQRLLLLLNAVDRGSLGGGSGHRVDGVRLSDDVRLVAGRRREVVSGLGRGRSGGGLERSRGGLDWSGGVLDGSGSVLDRSDGRAGLLSRSGGSGSVVLLDGSARCLLGGLLADVTLVDGALLGSSNVLLGH